MTGRTSARKTSIRLVALLLSCLFGINAIIVVAGEPEPLPPGMIYTDNFAEDTENFLLLNRLKQLTERKQEMIEQERELTEEQMTIQAMLEAKAREHEQQQRISGQGDYGIEDSEVLPVPSAIVHPGPLHSGKRTSSLTKEWPTAWLDFDNFRKNSADSRKYPVTRMKHAYPSFYQNMTLCHFKICNMGRKRQS